MDSKSTALGLTQCYLPTDSDADFEFLICHCHRVTVDLLSHNLAHTSNYFIGRRIMEDTHISHTRTENVTLSMVLMCIIS